MDKLLSRGFVGVLYVVFISIITTLNPYLFIAGFLVLFAFCSWEIIRLLQFDEKYMVFLTISVSAYLFYNYGSDFLNGIPVSSYSLASYLPLLLTFAAYFIVFKKPVELAYDSSKLIFIIAYLSLPFVLFISLAKKSEFDLSWNFNPLLAFFVLLWLSDTMAYITGSLIGKTKMSKISQNKTWEGLIGGMFFVILTGILYELYLTDLRGNWIVIAIMVAVLAPLGDLAESKLKRVFGLKDTGNLLGGHGGFLDRLDSFLLGSIGFYLYFLIEGL